MKERKKLGIVLIIVLVFGGIILFSPIIFHTHTIESKVSVLATCATEGLEVEYCIECEKTLLENVIPKNNNHKWKESKTVEPTYYEDGMTSFLCIECEEIKEVAIPSLSNTYRWGLCEYWNELSMYWADLTSHIGDSVNYSMESQHEEILKSHKLCEEFMGPTFLSQMGCLSNDVDLTEDAAVFRKMVKEFQKGNVVTAEQVDWIWRYCEKVMLKDYINKGARLLVDLSIFSEELDGMHVVVDPQGYAMAKNPHLYGHEREYDFNGLELGGLKMTVYASGNTYEFWLNSLHSDYESDEDMGLYNVSGRVYREIMGYVNGQVVFY